MNAGHANHHKPQYPIEHPQYNPNSSVVTVQEDSHYNNHHEINVVWTNIKDRLPAELNELLIECINIIKEIMPEAVIEASKHILHDILIIKKSVPINIQESIKRIINQINRIWPEISQNIKIEMKNITIANGNIQRQQIVARIMQKISHILHKIASYIDKHYGKSIAYPPEPIVDIIPRHN